MHAPIIDILLEALLASAVCLLAWALFCVAIVARRRTIVKRQFPGPPTSSFLLGNPLAPPSTSHAAALRAGAVHLTNPALESHTRVSRLQSKRFQLIAVLIDRQSGRDQRAGSSQGEFRHGLF